jgi:hypothetical protein
MASRSMVRIFRVLSICQALGAAGDSIGTAQAIWGSRLYWSESRLRRSEIYRVHMSVNAARRSACATYLVSEAVFPQIG